MNDRWKCVFAALITIIILLVGVVLILMHQLNANVESISNLLMDYDAQILIQE